MTDEMIIKVVRDNEVVSIADSKTGEPLLSMSKESAAALAADILCSLVNDPDAAKMFHQCLIGMIGDSNLEQLDVRECRH